MNPHDDELDKQGASAVLDAGGTSRRQLLQRAGFVAGAVWVAPIVSTLNTPAAAASGQASASLWKYNQDPPSVLSACDGTARSGTANRGSAVFRRQENPTPTIFVDITIDNGPSLTGTCADPDAEIEAAGNVRDVFILQSDAGTNCLLEALAGCFNGANNTSFTFSTPIVAGAVNFAVALVQSGGGGTNTYLTAPRVNLP